MEGLSEYIKKELESQQFQDELKLQARRKLIAQLIESVGWQTQSAVQATVKEWFDEHGKRNVTEALTEELPAIEKELKSAISLVAAELGKALLTQATENMAESYNRRELVKKVFE